MKKIQIITFIALIVFALNACSVATPVPITSPTNTESPTSIPDVTIAPSQTSISIVDESTTSADQCFAAQKDLP